MTNYFTHDYNAQNDIKLQNLIMKMDYQGLGWYWCIVEMLYQQGGKIELEKCQSIAFALRTDSDKIQKLIDIVFVKDDKYFWSETILKRLKIQKEKSKSAKTSAQKRWGNEARKGNAPTNANAMPTHSEGNANKGNKRKVNKKKDNTPIPPEGISVFLNTFNKNFDSTYRETDGRRKKLASRLEVFTLDQILLSIENLAKSNFHRGKNDRGWKADPDFLLRSDEQIDKWLNPSTQTQQSGELEEIVIRPAGVSLEEAMKGGQV